MQIPKNLPQFKSPALFVASGEYEADFYLAHRGLLEKKEELKMPPREEAREKQGFIAHKGGMQDLSSVSHHGAYVEDLKRKFQRRTAEIIHDFINTHHLQEIYLFAPDYVVEKIASELNHDDQKKVRMKFSTECTKINPLEMIEMFQKEIEAAIAIKKAPLKKEEEKILKKPKIKIP